MTFIKPFTNFLFSCISYVPLHTLNLIFRKIYIKTYSIRIFRKFKNVGNSCKVLSELTLTNPQYISLGNNVRLGKNVILSAFDNYNNKIYFPEIVIGDSTIIGDYNHISCISKISIGKNVLMGRFVTISDNSHGQICLDELQFTPMQRKLYSKGNIIIENNVWVGDKVTILAGVLIGENAIIGANSVVTKNVPANSVVGGIPAHLIKKLDLL